MRRPRTSTDFFVSGCSVMDVLPPTTIGRGTRPSMPCDHAWRKSFGPFHAVALQGRVRKRCGNRLFSYAIVRPLGGESQDRLAHAQSAENQPFAAMKIDRKNPVR